jgi:hypothetical protein
MNNTVYNVIFRGKIVSGQDIDKVKEELATLYKWDLTMIEQKFFAGKTVIVKSKLDYQQAHEYALKLTLRTGAKFEIYAIPEVAPQTATEVASKFDMSEATADMGLHKKSDAPQEQKQKHKTPSKFVTTTLIIIMVLFCIDIALRLFPSLSFVSEVHPQKNSSEVLASKIVGKWQSSGFGQKQHTVEFFSDGRLAWAFDTGKVFQTGDWVVLDDGRIKLEPLMRVLMGKLDGNVLHLEERDGTIFDTYQKLQP